MSTTIIQSDSIEKGGLTIPLFHCIFKNNGTVTHFLHEYKLHAYQALPNLYVICLANKAAGKKKVEGAFFIKTTYHHKDKDFMSVLANNINVMTELKPLFKNNSSFLPALLRLSDELPITEDEMLRMATKQYFKFDESGTIQ